MRGAQPWQTNRARVLRSQPISAEAKLWLKLRNRQLSGLKFVRQAPIAGHYADSVCRSRKVVVEVDGATHGTNKERLADEVRSARLEAQGYRIFRTLNSNIYENLDGVLDSLLQFINGDEE